ncbi:hypothetical protein AIOL_001930 [Candidatus Rhodobacter oscarellae]|uniref:Uncharacterized protein n=1 Tax=Candidatus Rhodobacter oscarellae TaxID=1675527 RepID=A0A0J9E2P0_9RHOB|nr:hypothetical protein AIOL_001930 [Candidatus Rhodobacter lobularis]
MLCDQWKTKTTKTIFIHIQECRRSGNRRLDLATSFIAQDAKIILRILKFDQIGTAT